MSIKEHMPSGIKDALPKRRAASPSLDVLRMVAAILVVCYHYLYSAWTDKHGITGVGDVIGSGITFPEAMVWTWWGWIGVPLFFVISGFVITMSASGHTARSFAVRRYGRLYPALLTFSTFALVVMWADGLLSIEEAASRWLRTMSLFPEGPWIDGVVWTLTVEVIFYALIFIVLCCRAQARLPALTRAAVVIVGVFWAIVLLAPVGNDGFGVGDLARALASRYVSRPLLLTTGSYFLVGMLGYEMFERGYNRNRALWAVAAITCSAVAIYFEAMGSPAVTGYGYSAAVPVIIWLSAIAIATAANIIEQRIYIGRGIISMARHVGLLTYPLYLVHYITGAAVLAELYRLGIDKYVSVTLAITFCLLISELFLRIIEPALRRLLAIDSLIQRTPGIQATARAS